MVWVELKPAAVTQFWAKWNFTMDSYANGYVSLVLRLHPVTRKNGLVNRVRFLGLAHVLATV